MEKTYFSKVIKEGNESETKHLLYIKSKWADNGVELIINDSDKNETFKGELTAQQLKVIANDLGIPFNDFYEECKETVTAKVVLPAYFYRLENDCFRLIKKQTFEIELMEIPLKKLSSSNQLIDAAFEEIFALNERKEETRSLAQQEETSSKEILELLRSCSKEKQQIEKTLIKKFMMLLNSKKEEIIKLKEQLETNRDHHKTQENEINDYDALTQPISQEAMEV